MEEIRFNIENFEIGNKDEWYKKFFIFLIRYFFSSKNFSWRFSKKEFINEWIKRGFNERVIKNIYDKWKNNNPYLNRIERKWKHTYIEIKSLFNKNKSSNLLIYINKEILKRISNIKLFKSLSYIIIASRPLKINNEIKKNQYINKNPSRVLRSIWKKFWNTEKSTMSKRLTKASERFEDIFKITNRYTYYAWFMVQISNLYSIEWVRYKNMDNKRRQWNIEKARKNWHRIKNKFINNKTVIFWDIPKEKRWFLREDLYEDFYLKIKEEVFK